MRVEIRYPQRTITLDADRVHWEGDRVKLTLEKSLIWFDVEGAQWTLGLWSLVFYWDKRKAPFNEGANREKTITAISRV